MRCALLALVTPLCMGLAGCDLLGIEGATVVAERKAAEGKAIGAACRHAGRAIEDCYVLNKKAEKASIYAGWREMDDYMRENKLEPVPPQIKAETPKSKSGGDGEEEAEPSAKVADAEAKPKDGKEGKDGKGKKVASAH
ncbi:hypothetical protein AACH06_16245 [Ideonella sp. DXS29W]|uniref:Uncharacterized protein n=1 Tax=Ideonella lacteola TaxID=2984193 RepID=A0ABU9BR02_9BURK